MKTNGTNLGGNHASEQTVKQLLNIGIKIVLNAEKIVSDIECFIPLLGIIGKGPDIIFNVIDTSELRKNLITTCIKLTNNQQFFMNELKKFNYILKK